MQANFHPRPVRKALSNAAPRKTDVLILGAGAAGLMCAREASAHGLDVALLERAPSPGRKLCISGGGKANFTNRRLAAHHYACADPSFCEPALDAFTPQDMERLVHGWGLPVEERAHGQLFLTVPAKRLLDALVQGQFSTAWDAFLHLLLPAFALSLGGMFQDARLMRSALTDNMGKEYMCVSRSYGLPEKVLMNRYLFKPSSTSVITVMGMDIASMVGNAFMVEQVFNWPGFSKYGANAMITKDLNSVCAVVLVIGATFLVVNLIVDVINAMVDPRIRLGGDL